jgi:hypothetical protein
MATLQENIKQAISDFDDIEAAIVESGVEVPNGTNTSEYGSLIRSINRTGSGSGHTHDNKDVLDNIDTLFVRKENITTEIKAALVEAKASGEFDGADGYTPVKGTDYFTEADKAEIVEDVVEEMTTSLDNIPDYWQTALDSGTEKINSAIETAGANKSAFLFYTDAHWGYGSAMSPKLLKHLCENTAMNKVNFGGDYMNNYSVATGEYLATMRSWRKAVRNLPNHHSVIGNHDYYDNYIPELESDAQQYGFLLAPEETNDIVRGDYFHYYIDNQPEKTRYIYLDTGLLFVSDNSTRFIIEALNSTPDGWHVVVISHVWFVYDSTDTPTIGTVPAYCQKLLDLFDAYNSRSNGSVTMNSTAISYDFTNGKGKVEFCIGGHTHVDYIFTSTNKIPVVLCQTDSYHCRGSYKATQGTTTEASISGIIADYDSDKLSVVRIGRGSNFEVVLSTGDFTEIPNDTPETEEPIKIDNVLFVDEGVENDLAVGYEPNTRLSGGDGSTVALNGRYVTGFIPVKQGDILHLENITMPNNKDSYNGLFIFYNENKTKYASVYASEVASSANMAIVYGADGNLKQIKNDYGSAVKYIRFCAANIDETSIITIN